jgi:uncharacterized membrane protein
MCNKADLGTVLKKAFPFFHRTNVCKRRAFTAPTGAAIRQVRHFSKLTRVPGATVICKLILLTLLGALIQACNSYTPKDGGQSPGVYGSSVPDFATIQAVVFKPYCLSCHSGAGGNQGNLNLETYAGVAANISNIQQQAVVSRTMPPSGPIPGKAQQALVNWISNNYPEFVNNPAPAPTPGGSGSGGSGSSNATFTWLNQNLFQPKCVACHGPGGSESRNPLNSYQNIMNMGWITAGNPSGSRLYQAVSGGSMPPGGGVSAATVQALSAWITSGASNN